MKNTILICLLAFSFSTFAQTIRRVNNNSGVTGVNVYTTIQAAHDAANIGDIIYVEPTTTSYGGLNATKRLTIIGAGNSLSQNSNTPFDKRECSIAGIITFNTGTANSIITGIAFLGSSISIKDANITITKCYQIGGITLSAATNSDGIAITLADNTTISHCFETGNITGDFKIFTSRVNWRHINGTIIKNNIRLGTLHYLDYSTVINNTSNVGSGGWFLRDSDHNIISNNIFTNVTYSNILDDPTNSVGNTISNNLSLKCSNCNISNYLPSDNGNQNNINQSSVFVSAESPGIDKEYQLAIGSPAIGAGSGGVDCGAFGGSSPYILSGLPPYPIITNFTTSGVGNSTTPLQVSVSVRGNN